MLASRMETLARDLYPGARRRGNLLRIGDVDGSPGESLAINLAGARAGRWVDYASGEYGDALDLVRAARHCDPGAALAWARGWLGLDSGAPSSPRAAPLSAPSRSPPRVDPDSARRAKRAGGIFHAGVPLPGTPAEAYLRGRGIEISSLRSHGALRYLSHLMHSDAQRAFPAIVAAIVALDGTLIGVHRTWLAPDGRGGWGKAPVPHAKMSFGAVAGGTIRLSSGAERLRLPFASPSEEVVIGEGIETCLSIAGACPDLRVLCAVSLSNLGRVELPPQIRRVILAADNDEGLAARRGLARAIEAHRAAGREVRVARSPIGKDFNDVAQAYARPP